MTLTARNILIAEDNATNRFVVETQLKEQGCTLHLAENGQQAIDIYKKYSSEIELILMDIAMPQMDGLEATKEIRKIQQETSTKAPIIALTAHALKDDRQKCLDAGMDDYLAKPFSEEDFINIVRKHLI